MRAVRCPALRCRRLPIEIESPEQFSYEHGPTPDSTRFHGDLLERHATVVGPGHWFQQPRTSFRLGFGWPTPDELAGGLAALDRAAERPSGRRQG